MMSSTLLATNPTAIQIRGTTAGNNLMKHKGELLSLVEVDKEAPATKTCGIANLDDPVLDTSSKEDVLLMNKAAEAFVKSDRKPTSFKAIYFHR